MARAFDPKLGVGLASMSLMSALLEKLRQQGLLERQEIVELVDAALSYVDLFDPEGTATEATMTATSVLEDIRRSYRDDTEMA